MSRDVHQLSQFAGFTTIARRGRFTTFTGISEFFPFLPVLSGKKQGDFSASARPSLRALVVQRIFAILLRCPGPSHRGGSPAMKNPARFLRPSRDVPFDAAYPG
jgi:hypothetical protein